MRPILLIVIELIGVIAVTQLLSISPALVGRRPVKFTQPRREGTSAISVAVLIILVTAILSRVSGSMLDGAVAFLPFTSSMSVAKPTISINGLITQIGLIALLAVPCVINVFRRKQPWLSVGLKQSMLKGGLQVGLALIMITVFLRGKIFTLIKGPYSIEVLYLFLASLVVCFGEEFIFRGYVQLRLMVWWGERTGWLVTAALFTLWSVLPLLNASIETLLITLAYRLGMGLLLGWIARKTGSILGGWMYQTVHLFLFWL